MQKKFELFLNNKNIQKVINEVKKDKYKLHLTECPTNIQYLLTASLIDNNAIYVTSNIYKASKAYDRISSLVGSDNVCFYVENEVIATEVDVTNKDLLYERLNTLSCILNNENKIIVTTITSVLKELMPLSLFKESIITLKCGDVLDRKSFLTKLITLGYRKEPTTTEVGCFSVRGEVIDIYPYSLKNPIRINFFDDEIENIRYFDCITQLTNNATINEIQIFPNTEFVLLDNKKVIQKIKNDIVKENIDTNNDIFDIENYNYHERLTKYLNYCYDHTECFLDYISNSVILFDDVSILKESYDKVISELNYYLDDKKDNGLNYSYYYNFGKIKNYNNVIECTEFLEEDKDNYINIDIKGYTVPTYHNNMKLLLDDIKNSPDKVVLCFESEEKLSLMKEILRDKGLSVNNFGKKIELIKDNIFSFAIYGYINVISESSIYNINTKNYKYKSVLDKVSPISSKTDLKPGDYVVHQDYGIGQYEGIKTVENHGLINDFIYIKFANIELGIPVENISMLEKFKAEESYVPKLTVVGNGEWEKKKQKIKEQVDNISKELLILHAYREAKMGYKYAEDDEIQINFENDFEYEETKDQLKAIETIKKDMESGKIIDRLVCGDVGFGKTEIAIRIAMKTVLNGKQVAMLAPTTILSRQHFYSFQNRMEKYGVRVALLNRLVNKKTQKVIIEEVAKGNIDVLIGTHAILSDKIRYKDLGLLIVDEEQRFGVVHKEKIKQYKNNINVITLTATPIPRTMQMTLVGARQISMIETSPVNRYPVQTFVLKQNDIIIREAIYKELGNNGQVFYMHNEVKTLDFVYNKIHKLVPESRIIVVHGQMNKDEIEDNIDSFIKKDYDVLLCTSIIETGIDIPNTNTLIVDNADRLGLAQMYQIRGRVGRSNKVAYAYFMYDPLGMVNNDAIKRLNALKEFASLGSGYHIALRDLAIRGAGNFLGKEQSGYIDSVGMELYMKMLNESMQGIIENESEDKIDSIEISKYVDDKYVSDDDIKIYIHKTINSIKTNEDRIKVLNEFNDRFGKITKEIEIYINKQYLDSLAKEKGIESIYENDLKLVITLSKEKSKSVNAKKMMQTVYELGDDYDLKFKNNRFVISIIKITDKDMGINKAIKVVSAI